MTQIEPCDLLLDEKQQTSFSSYQLYSNGELRPLEYIPNFNQINILVGANNSGKSRFMRNFVNLKNYIKSIYYKNPSETLNDYNQSINQINKEIEQQINMLRRNEINTKTHEPSRIVIDQLRASILNNLDELDLEKINNNLSKIKNITPHIDIKFECREKLQKFEPEIFLKKIFIPTLRSAHSLFEKEMNKELQRKNPSKIEEDIFLTTIQKNYPDLKDLIEKQNLQLFTGLSLYREILNSRNSTKDVRQKFESFEKFIGDHFFNGKQIDIVAQFNKDENLDGKNENELINIHIESEKDRKLYELGDGIQALIILMYPIFMAEKDSIIFIDEPELNLHPGMQRLFLEQITSNEVLTDKKLRYVIATHSNHFLDLTLQEDSVSIYSFRPKINNGNKNFIIQNVHSGDKSILDNLGVNNSSVFLANCSIWVEGISDRNILKAFLYAYCQQEDPDKEGKKIYPYPKEDIDFAFFEYSGSNLKHYLLDEVIDDEEIKEKINAFALNNRIFLIADEDEGKESKHTTLKNISEGNPNFSFRTTKPCREIENMLSKEVWKKILIEFVNKNAVNTDEKKHEIQEEINKEIDQITNEDFKKFQTQYIGEFLASLQIKDLNEIYKPSKTGNGTFSKKADLSKLILDKTKEDITWNDFAEIPEVIQLTEELYKFITKQEKSLNSFPTSDNKC